VVLSSHVLADLERVCDHLVLLDRSHLRLSGDIEGLLATDLRHDLHALGRAAVRANIRASVQHLRHGSDIIEQLIQKAGLLVVGAEYSLETGVVDFFDGLPPAP